MKNGLTPGMHRCPVHEDRAPSLHVTLASDGRVLLHCHAGCSPDAVRRALGLEWAELAPSGLPPRRPRAIPPPAAAHDSAAILAEALAMERAQVKRIPPDQHRSNDRIRGLRRRAEAARRWVTRWGDREAAWVVAALAARLDQEADDLEASMGA